MERNVGLCHHDALPVAGDDEHGTVNGRSQKTSGQGHVSMSLGGDSAHQLVLYLVIAVAIALQLGALTPHRTELSRTS